LPQPVVRGGGQRRFAAGAEGGGVPLGGGDEGDGVGPGYGERLVGVADVGDADEEPGRVEGPGEGFVGGVRPPPRQGPQ